MVSILETESSLLTSTQRFIWSAETMSEARDSSNAILHQYFSFGQTTSGSDSFYPTDLFDPFGLQTISTPQPTPGGSGMDPLKTAPRSRPVAIEGLKTEDYFVKQKQHWNPLPSMMLHHQLLKAHRNAMTAAALPPFGRRF